MRIQDHLNSHDSIALPVDHFVHGTEATATNLTEVTKVICSEFNLLEVQINFLINVNYTGK